MPGPPFNVGPGGFPVSHATCCGILTNTSRADLRTDLNLSAQAVATLNFFLGTPKPEGFVLECNNGTTIRGHSAVLACQVDIVSMLSAYDAHLEMPHEGPAGPAGPRGDIGLTGITGPTGLTGFAGAPGEFPTLGTPDFTSLLGVLAAAIGALGGGAAGPAGPAGIPGLPAPIPLEPVAAGGTVNVPVVLGATGDPSGVRRPRFPDPRELETAAQVGEVISRILALRKARQNADKQRRAFEQFLANRLEILRRAQMPFGQSGFVAAGPLLGGTIGGALGGLASDALEALVRRLAGGGDVLTTTQLPAFPQQLPPGIPGLSGGAAVCPPLFQGGVSARLSPVPWFPVQAPSGKWFFFGHLGRPTFSKLKSPRRHHHHARKR